MNTTERRTNKARARAKFTGFSAIQSDVIFNWLGLAFDKDHAEADIKPDFGTTDAWKGDEATLAIDSLCALWSVGSIAIIGEFQNRL